MIPPTMGLLDSIRRLLGRTEDALNELDYAALDAVHRREIPLESALVRRSSLEDVFLHLTGRTLIE